MNHRKEKDSYSVLGKMGRKLSVVGAFIGEKRSQENNSAYESVKPPQNVRPRAAQSGEKMMPANSQGPKRARKSFYETDNRIQKSVWINKPLRREVVNMVDELKDKSLPFTEGQLLRESVEAGWPAIRKKYLKMLFRLGDLRARHQQL